MDARFAMTAMNYLLLTQGIESISLKPDTVVDTWRRLAQPA